MKIRVFFKSANDDSFNAPLNYMSKSISQDGFEVIDVFDEEYQPCDLAIFFGSWKNREVSHHIIKRKIIKFSPNFIVIETPILGRGAVANIMQDNWYRIGLNGFLNHTGKFNNYNCKPNRWNKLKKHFQINLKPWRDKNNKGPIIIVLQLPGDASMCDIDVSRWAYFCVTEIRKITNRLIIIREPQIIRNFNLVQCQSFKDVIFQRGTFENKIKTLDEAWCTVTFSSGMGVESIINGCPTIAMHPASFAYEISSNNLSEIENPKMVNRDKWLYNLAYTTWSLDEIKEGKPWLHLKPLLISDKK